MMPVGAGGGGGFLRGRPAKPPSSRASRPPGARASSAGRAGGEGSGLAGAPGLGAPPAGGQVGRRRLSARAGPGVRGSGVRGLPRGPGAGAAVVEGPGAGGEGPWPAPARPPARPFPPEPPRPGCPGGEAGGGIGAGQLPPPHPVRPGGGSGGEAGVSFSARPVAGSRGASVPPTPPEICWCRIWSRPCGCPRVVFPRWKPTFLRSPFRDF